MKIHVRNRDFGFWSATPVTVQVIDWHRDEEEPYKDLLWCNHDGYQEDHFDMQRILPNLDTEEWKERVEACDKCRAWRYPGYEEWNDAPFEGVKVSEAH